MQALNVHLCAVVCDRDPNVLFARLRGCSRPITAGGSVRPTLGSVWCPPLDRDVWWLSGALRPDVGGNGDAALVLAEK